MLIKIAFMCEKQAKKSSQFTNQTFNLIDENYVEFLLKF